MNDPLNINLTTTGVDTSFPVLKEATLTFQITESVPKPNKDQNGHNWNLKLTTTEPAETTDGKIVPPGFSVFHVVALQARPDAQDPQGFLKGIAQVQDAIDGTDATNRATFNKSYWESVVGKTVKAHIVVDEYPKGSGSFNNKVKRFVKP